MKYVALIRGIGPGDPRKTNEKLRGALEELGFTNVESVISSGNIIFESNEKNVTKVEDTIEQAWPRLLGFNATTIVKSQQQLQAILDSDPFSGVVHGPGSYLLVSFFKQPVKVSFTLPYKPKDKPYKLINYTDKTLFTITDNTATKTTDLMTWIEKQFSKEVTSRTPLTLQRIVKRMS